MGHFLFTSESVAVGHPDKLADQISDAILDECIRGDPYARVACETLLSRGMVILSGEITTSAHCDYVEVARETIRRAGYNRCELGFEYRSCGVISLLQKQSPEIAHGVDEKTSPYHTLGAGDQGLMFGFACDETPQLMPLPIALAHRLILALREGRESGEYPYLRPDGKSQVTIEYDESWRPQRLHTAVLSTQHDSYISHDQLVRDMRALIARVTGELVIDENTLFYINPAGPFVLGGPAADCGLTGRKIIVDTYGGMARHGGGAFSGKDPTKVDRSAAYMARYIAKQVVAAGLARRCEVQLAYAIGLPHPLSIKVDTFGTGSVSERLLAHAIGCAFDLSPRGIIEMLDLRRPIYSTTCVGGHFGQNHPEHTWERIDRAELLREAVKSSLYSLDE